MTKRGGSMQWVPGYSGYSGCRAEAGSCLSNCGITRGGWRLLGTVAGPRSQVSAPHSATAEVSRSPVSPPGHCRATVSVMISWLGDRASMSGH